MQAFEKHTFNSSPGQNQLNLDAKLLFAKLHEIIIRSHFISLL